MENEVYTRHFYDYKFKYSASESVLLGNGRRGFLLHEALMRCGLEHER